VGEEVTAWLAPVRERYLELRADRDRIEDVLEAGAEKARAIASATLADVREVMGVGPARRSVGPAA
jgi:tryptophanyl-tRNA synthetase